MGKGIVKVYKGVMIKGVRENFGGIGRIDRKIALKRRDEQKMSHFSCY